MTVASEITRLQTAKDNIRTSIQGKGVSVPASAKLDTYPWYIDQISVWTDILGLFKQVTPTSTEYSINVLWNPTTGWAINKNYITYNDANYWIYFYIFEPMSYNSSCAQWERYTHVNSFMWIVDKTNNYSVSKTTGWDKGIYYWRPADKNYWGDDCFWGTRYLYKKGTQLKFQSYHNESLRNYTYDYRIAAYWLYDLTIDLSTKTVLNSQIYSNTKTSWYSETPLPIPDAFLYENLEQHPDNTWALLGNPSGNSMNFWYSWYSVTPTFNWDRSASCYWAGTVALLFTAT